MSLLITGQGRPNAIELEHAELKPYVEVLVSACHSPKRDQSEVQDQTESLAEAVQAHFALEERGGYFADVVRMAPHLSTTAAELQAQHEPLLESLEALRALARTAVKSDAGWARLREEVAQFADELLQHEAGERAMLQRAHGQDIGAGD